MESSILIIIACYAIFTLFAFLTLPVEYDASKRALAWIKSRNIVNQAEHEIAKDALNTAAQTYLIAALSSLATLFYWVMVYIGGNRDWNMLIKTSFSLIKQGKEKILFSVHDWN